MVFEVDRSCTGSLPEHDFVSGALTGRLVRGVSDLDALLRFAAAYAWIRVLRSRGGAPGRYRLELGPGGEIGFTGSHFHHVRHHRAGAMLAMGALHLREW